LTLALALTHVFDALAHRGVLRGDPRSVVRLVRVRMKARVRVRARDRVRARATCQG